MHYVEDCLNEESCDEMVSVHKTCPPTVILNSDQVWNSRVVFFGDFPFWLQEKVGAISLEVANFIGKKYETKVWPETVSLVRWDNGSSMLVHKDGQQYNTKNRTHSALIYLTNNESGEIFFPNLRSFLPRKGLLVVFDKNTEHGVKEVMDGPRYTLSMWFTEDQKHARVDAKHT